MAEQVSTTDRSSYTRRAQPAKNYSTNASIWVEYDGQHEHFGWLWMDSPVPRGATVVSAKLVLTQAETVSGDHTVIIRRADESWSLRGITWDNQPGIIGTGAVAVTKTAPPVGTEWEFDVTSDVQSWSDGARNHGWRLHRSDVGLIKFRTDRHPTRGGPQLFVEWSEAPDTPEQLRPSTGAVSVSHPTLRCDYSDVSGDAGMAAIHVQIDAAQDGGAPDFNSGEVATDTPELDLSTTAFAGLADPEDTFWRVRVKDSDSEWSPWSKWAELSRRGNVSVTIDAPSTAAPTVGDFTPNILWSVTGGTQTHYRVIVFEQGKRGRVRYDSGKVAGTETSLTLPSHWKGRRVLVREDVTYVAHVRVWDDVEREATPGDPTFAADNVAFNVVEDGTVEPVANLTATQPGEGQPWIDLTWTRSAAPDSFLVGIDGSAAVAGIDPGDVLVSGTDYAMRLWVADPLRDQRIRVRAVESGVMSEAPSGAWVDLRPRVTGVWIGAPATGLDVLLYQRDPVAGATFGEDAERHIPLGSEAPVQITYGMRGLEQTMSGFLLVDGEGRTWDEWEERLLQIKADPTRTYRLVVGDRNIPVVLSQIDISATPEMRDGMMRKSVSFSYFQVGELPYSPDF